MRTKALILQSEVSKGDSVLGGISGHDTGSIANANWGTNIIVG